DLLSYDPSTSLPYTLSLHDALPIYVRRRTGGRADRRRSGRRGPRNARRGVRAVPVAAGLSRAHAAWSRRHAGGVSAFRIRPPQRSEEHTPELQSRFDLVCRLLLEKK